MKMCAGSCKLQLPLTDFGTKANGKPQSYCRECQKEYARQHYLANRDHLKALSKQRSLRYRSKLRTMLFEYLKQHPCVDCGETDIVVLQFDHVRGDKSNYAPRMISCGHAWETIAKEISKCDVRCANCHVRATAHRAGWARALVA